MGVICDCGFCDNRWILVKSSTVKVLETCLDELKFHLDWKLSNSGRLNLISETFSERESNGHRNKDERFPVKSLADALVTNWNKQGFEILEYWLPSGDGSRAINQLFFNYLLKKMDSMKLSIYTRIYNPQTD